MPTKSKPHLLGLVIVTMILMGCVAHPGTAAEDSAPKAKAKANRLAKESSPYLLMHAHNPVDWYPWGPEAFEKARKEGKLIFLSVGYSSCYWCHVMERKVFMNEKIAKVLNENFVCIKVDREERPDIDDVYMTALHVYYQLIQQPSSGGWPLSMFMTSEGKPVAGGTYFPPEDNDGATGFPTVLERLTDLWANKHEQMEKNANVIAEETRRAMRPKLALKGVEINEALVTKAFAAVADSIDPEFGGVDFNPQRPRGPKFPTPPKLLFLQEQVKVHPNADAADLINLTLMQMACGGIRDHVGGGFHRYSVDRQWQVPHFEKMLYDQAQLADVYVNGYVTTKNKLFKQVAEETLQFVQRELTSADGAFFSALDAETNGIEGEFYVWEARDIDRILGDKSAAFKELYHVKDLSDFEHGNVLRLSPDHLPGPARAGQVVAGNASSSFETDEFTVARQKLLAVRNQRTRIMRDEKILVGWNGLMIGALARAATALNQPEFLRSAEKAGVFVLTKMRDSQGRLAHSFTNGRTQPNAFLDDYACVIDGLLALHSATRDPRWLKEARQLQDDQIKMFKDDAGGFFFTSHDHEELLARTKNCYDGVVPAGNSVSARNLLKMAKLTSDKRYRDEAQLVLELFAANLEQMPRGSTVLAQAMSEYLAGEAQTRQSAVRQSTGVITVAADDVKAKQQPLVVFADQKDEAGVKPDEFVKAKAYLSVDRLPAGSACQIIVLIDVKKGWHVNANPPDPDYLKPVKISLKSKNGVKLGEIKYPKGEVFKFKDSDDKAMVYEGEVKIRGVLNIPKEAAGRTEEVEISVEYQVCNEDGCRPPKTLKLTGKLGVAKPDETVGSVNARLFDMKIDPSR